LSYEGGIRSAVLAAQPLVGWRHQNPTQVPRVASLELGAINGRSTALNLRRATTLVPQEQAPPVVWSRGEKGIRETTIPQNGGELNGQSGAGGGGKQKPRQREKQDTTRTPTRRPTTTLPTDTKVRRT